MGWLVDAVPGIKARFGSAASPWTLAAPDGPVTPALAFSMALSVKTGPPLQVKYMRRCFFET